MAEERRLGEHTLNAPTWGHRKGGTQSYNIFQVSMGKQEGRGTAARALRRTPASSLDGRRSGLRGHRRGRREKQVFT